MIREHYFINQNIHIFLFHEKHPVTKKTDKMEEYAREPCPYRIVDDCGGAFAMVSKITIFAYLLKYFAYHLDQITCWIFNILDLFRDALAVESSRQSKALEMPHLDSNVDL